MFCTNCGSRIEDGNAFCTKCGKKVDGASNPPTPLASPEKKEASGVRNTTAPAPAAGTHGVSTSGQSSVRVSKGVLIGLIVAVFVIAIAAIAIVFVVMSSGSASSSAPYSSTSAAVASSSSGSSSSSSSASASSSSSASSSAEAASDYILPDVATRLYTTEELSALSDWELYLARNEIYARHGRGFKNADLVQYFSTKPWYRQTYTPEQFDAMPSPLNDIERANSDSIRAIEAARGSQYAR